MISCIVIDDDQDIVNLFCDMLSTIGVDILATGNDGNEAVNIYKKHHPDLVFTDLNMPKYDGFYAITKIKDINPDSKIFAITGDSITSKNHLLASFNVKIIYKPFEMKVIKQIIADSQAMFIAEPKAFRILYKFKNDDNQYSCIVTNEQYNNFRLLPIIKECEIIMDEQKSIIKYQNEMEEAIEKGLKNETSSIRKLSKIV